MKKLLIALAVLLAAAIVFNPGPEAHRERLKAAVGERNQLAGVLGVGHLAAFASTYHSLGLASYSTLNGKVVTLGALGLVLVPDVAGP